MCVCVASFCHFLCVHSDHYCPQMVGFLMMFICYLITACLYPTLTKPGVCCVIMCDSVNHPCSKNTHFFHHHRTRALVSSAVLHPGILPAIRSQLHHLFGCSRGTYLLLLGAAICAVMRYQCTPTTHSFIPLPFVLRAMACQQLLASSVRWCLRSSSTMV